MVSGGELKGLLRQLEQAGSPLQRLRVLALAWRTVRGLSAKERADVATRLGIDGAEEVVNRLASKKSGLSPSLLLEAVHSARNTDPASLRRMISGLGDKDQRRELLKQGLAAVSERLTGNVEAPAEAEDPFPVDEIEIAERETPRTPLPAPPPKAPAPKLHQAEPEPQPAPSPRMVDVKPVAPPSTPLAAEPQPAPQPQEPARPRRAATERPPGVQPPPAVATVERESALSLAHVAEQMNSQRSLVGRLKTLRQALAQSPAARADEIDKVLAELPQGWARRRAILALLGAGLPADTSQALALIAALEAEHQRAWCLSALIRARELSDGALEGALGLLRSPATRRRLRRIARPHESGQHHRPGTPGSDAALPMSLGRRERG